MHHFRAIAIIFVVLEHLWLIPMFNTFPSGSEWCFQWLMNSLIGNASSIFVFISGYLFCLIESKRISEANFIQWGGAKFAWRKIINVYSPMIFMSFLISCIGWLLGKIIVIPGFLYFPQIGNVINGSFIQIVEQIALGRLQGQYWYIPFIMVVYFFSPILLKCSNKQLICLSLVGLLLPILRTKGSLDLYESGAPALISVLCYHGPFFIFGVFFYKNEEWLSNVIHKSIILLMGLYCVLVFFRLLVANSQHFAFSLDHFRNICEIGMLYYLLGKVKTVNPVLDLIARYSFGIYFLHVFIGINFFRVMNYYLLGEITSILAGEIFVLFSVLISFAICMFIIWIMKFIFGKRSRCFIGA